MAFIGVYIVVHLLIGAYMALAVSMDSRDEAEFYVIWVFFLAFSFWSIPIIAVSATALALWRRYT